MVGSPRRPSTTPANPLHGHPDVAGSRVIVCEDARRPEQAEDDMTQQTLTVTSSSAEELTVLSVAGEIDHDSRDILWDAADAAFQAGRRWLVVDLSAVTFCDSGGLSLFVDLHKRAAALGGELRLAGVQPPVATVLLATNLDRLLRLHPTVAEAVGSLGSGG
jgi:anti-anti-sigma factor